MRFFRTGLGLCAVTAILTPASAQTASAQTAAAQTASPQTTAADTSKKPVVETVTVKATRPAVQVLPDRVVYSLDKNIQSSTSTLSDVLRNIPSVNVDIEGNVSLRGDSNVTILIDGKKSPLLAGNLADALQQIPAEMVDRIEVVTNPSAEFRAEGSGGIINIVLKKNKELAASGIVRVNFGNKGRLNASASGNIKIGRLALNGGYGERRDVGRFITSTVRSDGTNLQSTQNIASQSKYSGRYAWLGADLDLNGRDDFNLGGSYNRFGGHFSTLEHDVALADASDIMRDGLSLWQREGAGVWLGYSHKFAAKDEELSLELSRYTSWGLNLANYTNFPTGSDVADLLQSRQSISRDTNTEFKADYTLPLRALGKLKLGYDLQNDTSLSNNNGLYRNSTTADWIPDSTFINDFTLDRTIHAFYVSDEKHFGRFGVMSGLRLEQDFLSTDLITTGETHNTQTLGFYPSVHLSYALTDTQLLGLSYSRRMNRPGTYALNPAKYSSDAFNAWAGNPYLKPEQVDSFEASYRRTADSYDAVVTGYYRATYKGITNVYRYLSDTVLLTTFDNLARRMASGVETTVNATPLAGVTLRASGSVDYSEFNPGASGFGTKQSGINWNIKGGIDWQATPKDLIQFNAQYTGKQRFPQGYNDPNSSGDLGFKHSFEGGFAGVISINNLFNSWNRHTVLDAPGVFQDGRRSTLGRVYYAGLVYTFGGAKDTGETTGGDNNNAGSNGGAPGGP